MDKENVALSCSSASPQDPHRGVAVSSPLAKSAVNSGNVSFPSASKGSAEDDDPTAATISPSVPPRRAALAYPSSTLAAKSNRNPFSESAARRDSVMALGSIGYLQHLYAKQGIASKTRPVTKGALQLAIGRAGESMLAATPESPAESPTIPKMKLAGDDGKPLSEDQLVLIDSPVAAPLELPPSPKAPTSNRLPYPRVAKPVEADPEALWPLLLEDLDATCQLWGLFNLVTADTSVIGARRLSIEPGSRRPPSRSSVCSADGQEDVQDASSVDLLELINTTTKTIRSVRGYLLALPPASLDGKRIFKDAASSKQKDQFRRQSSFSNVSRRSSLSPLPVEKTFISLSLRRVSSPHTVAGAGGATPTTRAMPSAWSGASAATASPASPRDNDDAGEDPLTLVRKSALDVLGTLRELEEKYRLPPDHPLYSTAGTDSHDATADSALGLSLTSSDSGCEMGKGLKRLATLDNPSSLDVSFAGSPSRSGDSEGYLYRSDLKLSDLGKERESVNGYLATVDRVLSVVQRPKSGRRPSMKPSKSLDEEDGTTTPAAAGVTAASGLTITVDATMANGDADGGRSPGSGDSHPPWARKGEFPGGELGRIRAFLLAHLSPEDGFELLQASTEVSAEDNVLDVSRDELLSALVDGSLLCHAYNAALRQSGRPWGFIQPREIHDLKAAEAEAVEKQKQLAKTTEDEGAPFQVVEKEGRARREASSATDASEASSTATGGRGEGAGAGAASAAPEAVRARPGWTFRRAENLRVWAAALRLRYHIQTTSMSSLEPLNKPLLPGLQPPAKLGLHPRRVYSETSAASASASASSLSLVSSAAGGVEAKPPSKAVASAAVSSAISSSNGSSGGGSTHQGSAGDTIDFDPRKVARKEEGWEDMLYALVAEWVKAVASEERGEDSR